MSKEMALVPNVDRMTDAIPASGDRSSRARSNKS